MNKKVKLLVITGMAIVCGTVVNLTINTKAEERMTKERNIYDWEDVLELGRYTGYVINVADAEVTDAEIDAALNALVDAFPAYEVTGEVTADLDDCVKVSYRVEDGDGNLLPEFCADDVEIILCENGYPEDFRKGIVGMKCGETKVFGVILPNDFYSPTLRGKFVTYTVDLKSVDTIKTPDVTDEWIAGVTNYTSIADWKFAKRKEICNAKEENQDLEFENGVLNAVIADCKSFSLPEELISATVHDFTADDVKYAKELGISMSDFVCDYYNFNALSSYYADVRKRVTAYLKEWYVKEALVDVCGESITQEELNTFIEQITDEHDFGSTEECIEKYGMDLLRKECEMEKTWQKVLSQNSRRVV